MSDLEALQIARAALVARSFANLSRAGLVANNDAANVLSEMIHARAAEEAIFSGSDHWGDDLDRADRLAEQGR